LNLVGVSHSDILSTSSQILNTKNKGWSVSGSIAWRIFLQERIVMIDHAIFSVMIALEG
jgi:hypothetical protein